MTISTTGVPRQILVLITIFALAKTLLHLYTNAFQSYGIFRDELYYLACADHLAFGYVDQPPLSIWILFIAKNTFGTSLFAIRLLPAIFSGVSIFMVGMITYELGGRKIAIAIACFAAMISGIHLAYSTYYSMNVIDLMLWSILLYIMLKLIHTGSKKYWIYLGVLFGLALLNKIGALFLGFGFVAALLFSPHRTVFKTKWPYLAGSIAFLLFLPYVIWNATHDWAHLEFIHNASKYKYSGMNPVRFWSEQLLINNPVTVPLWICSILYLFMAKTNTSFRFLFIIFSGVALILTLNGTSKPEYLAAIFPVLVIGGGLLIERWSSTQKWITYATVLLLLPGVFLIPVAIPILPVHTYIRFSEIIGIKPESSEGKKLSELPQFYADMFGWEEKAIAVSRVYQSLSPAEQKVCVAFGDNYGRAAAIDYYASKYDLPRSIGKHNNYWVWGPGDASGEIVIILSAEVGDKNDLFELVEDKGVVTCDYCMPYENNLHIYLCRGLKIPIEQLWPVAKSFN